jgi:hypothetical protein
MKTVLNLLYYLFFRLNFNLLVEELNLLKLLLVFISANLNPQARSITLYQIPTNIFRLFLKFIVLF